MEWSKETTLKLIEMLEINEGLWKMSSDSYRDRNKKKDQIRFMAAVLGAETTDVEKKIQNLKTQYTRESAKEKRKSSTGACLYKSKWYALEHLHFLKDANKPNKIQYSVRAVEDAEEIDDQAMLISEKDFLDDAAQESNEREFVSTYTIKPTFCRKRNAESTTNTTPMEEFIDVKLPRSEENDEFDIFGQHISNELRKLKYNKYILVHTKKKIYEALMEADLMMLETAKSSTVTSSTCSRQSNQSHLLAQIEDSVENTDNIYNENSSTPTFKTYIKVEDETSDS